METHDWSKVIEDEAEKYSESKWKHPNSNLSRAHCSLDWMAGINSPLSKQICEVEKLEAKIELLKKITNKPVCFADRPLKTLLFDELYELEQTRDKLINELKLK